MKKNTQYDDLICVCMGKNCKKNGSKDIFHFLRESLKKSDPQSKFLIVKTKCLDKCKKGPVVIRNNKIYTRYRLDED